MLFLFGDGCTREVGVAARQPRDEARLATLWSRFRNLCILTDLDGYWVGTHATVAKTRAASTAFFHGTYPSEPRQKTKRLAP